MYCSNSMYIFIPQDLFIIGLLMFSTASCNLWFGHGHSTFDVFQYGAKGDGVSDDTQVNTQLFFLQYYVTKYTAAICFIW